MVPLVGSVTELRLARQEAEQVLQAVRAETGQEFDCPIGSMIELPRAALTAAEIATAAEFFSFGTNDLTQTTWGFSRDDVETEFFARYLDLGVFDVSPFESLDRDGVGELVRLAAQAGRRTRPGLGLGVCGEHAGDPRSIHFFHDVGLDYVSCSPFRVPIARLETGRAAVARCRQHDESSVDQRLSTTSGHGRVGGDPGVTLTVEFSRAPGRTWGSGRN